MPRETTNAQTLANCRIPAPFFLGEILVEVRSLEYRERNDLVVLMFLTRDGEYVMDPVEEFIFRNPPVMLSKGVRTISHPVHGIIEISDSGLDPSGALKEMISQTLQIVLKDIE